MGMLILILDGKTALAGGAEGIELCLKTVIPSLFPFFVLSILLTSSLSGVTLPVLRPLGRLCGMPEGTEALLISGFLGGYPVGAQSVAAVYRSGQLPRREAERLLAFCSNAGPAFLFGMASSLFPRQWMAWALWGIHIAGAVFAAVLLPGGGCGPVRLPEKKALSLKCLLRSDCKRQKPIFIFKSNLICATKLVVQIGETIRCCVDLILRGITAVPEFTGCLCINLICSVGFQSIIRSDRAVKD